MTCLTCAGWGCTRCTYSRLEARGEQGLEVVDLEVERLRAEVRALRDQLNALSFALTLQVRGTDA